MRTKNIIITIAALATGIIVSSCAKKSDFDSYRETTDSRFGTVEEQAAYLNGVMETIGAEQELLGTFLDTLQTASDSFASEVDSLMEDLDGRMQAVHDSLKGYTKKTELEATFATLASVNTLSGVLAAIEVKLKSDSLVLTAALKNSIKATESKITEKFKSYYKKGELDALLAAQSRRMDTLSANADSAAKEIGIIRESIAELQKRYAGISSTLNSRIEELKKTDDDIDKSIKELDGKISTELESLKPKVAANTAAIADLEARVRKLEIRVQSIEVVPEYADGSVDMKKGSTAIRFEVRPRYLIDSLAGKPGLFSFQIIKTAAATKAGIFADTITVKSVAKSAEDSLLTVTVDGTEMPADFFAETQTYSARLVLSDGNTDRTSAYFPLTPPVIAYSFSSNTVSMYQGTASTVTLLHGTDVVTDAQMSDFSLSGTYDGISVTSVTAGVVTLTATSAATAGADARLQYRKNGTGSVLAKAAVSVTVLPVLSGEFSVASGKRVSFSGGNLQYQASTGTWRFAEHQNDYIGNNPGNTTATGRETQSDWIDLFGWGATGRNEYGQQPYSISTTDKDYKTVETASNDETLTIANKADWGYCIGGAESIWRTLSKDEWNYLLSTRKVTVGGQEKASYGEGSVEGVTGLIILPDNWNGEVYSGFTYGKSAWSNTFSGITTPTWSAMESAGCVFLPAGGYRNGSGVSSVSSYGYYWSSTAYFTSESYCLKFSSNSVTLALEFYRSRGCSVRLVTDVVE